MSPTIRSKGGLPLMVGGQVAGSQECCCENPPPPVCLCGSFCSYFIELVAPSALSVRSRVVDCGNLNENPSSVQAEDSLLQDIVPVLQGDNGDFDFPRYYTAATALNSHLSQSLSVTVREEIAGFPTFLPPELYYFQLFALRRASITISCVTEIEGPKFYATLLVSAAASYGMTSLGFSTLGTWARLYRGTFEIPAQCVASPRRECFPTSQKFVRISTPLEITLSGDGTSSLGNLSMDADGGPNSGGLPPEFPYARDAVDAILDATNYTFRITSRFACRAITCQCDALLRGLPLEFEGSGGAIGTEVEEWTSLGESEGFGRYAYGSGDQTWTIRHEKTDGFNLQIFNRRQLDIYCEQTVDGPVWRALIRTFCYEPNAVLEDVWMGRFLCYETVCEDLENNRPLNGPIPQEEPVEVEYLGRTYYGTFEPTCTPPPKPFVRLGQNTSC